MNRFLLIIFLWLFLFHAPPLLSGVGDGVVQQITQVPQLVKMGCEMASDKKKIVALWTSIKGISPATIKKAAIKFYETKKAQYTSDKKYIVAHAVGSDGVQAAMLLTGAGELKAAKEGEEAVEKGVEETGEDIAEKSAESLIDDIAENQAETLGKVESGEITLDNNFKKGNFGEMGTDVELAQKGYKPLHTRITDIGAAPAKRIDGVFEKDGQYFIVESKYSGTSKLKNTNGGPQMSDQWINGSLPGKTVSRLEEVVGKDTKNLISNAGYQRVLSEVAPDGKIVYKSIGTNGSIGQIVNL